jgi:hypothetical protein
MHGRVFQTFDKRQASSNQYIEITIINVDVETTCPNIYVSCEISIHKLGNKSSTSEQCVDIAKQRNKENKKESLV